MKANWLLVVVIGFLLSCVSFCVQADSGAGRGLHKKLYIVPAAHKVTIDAKLDDWDLSGQIFCYVYRETADMQSARIAMMYDGEALYVCGVVRDTSPLMNRHDPKIDPEKAWDADVCQLFINLDPGLGYPLSMSQFHNNQGKDKDLASVYLWYFTDRKEPCLALQKGIPQKGDPRFPPRGAVPFDRFQGVYAALEDGQGYTFEYRIPWDTLGAPRPIKAGDITAGTVMVFWSSPDGLKTAGGSAWAYEVMAFAGFPHQNSACWGKFIFSPTGNIAREAVEEGLPPEKPLPLAFEYDLPEDGFATIQLVQTNGTVARLLVAQAERKAGKNVERWDGLDDTGKSMAPGPYAWRGLVHKGIRTRFRFSAHNSGQPPYKTDDNTGGWGGDHGVPMSVCAFNDGMVLTWSLSESGWGIISTDGNGKKRWGIKHNAVDVASDGRRVFVIGDRGFEGADSVKPFDGADGRPLSWGNGKLALEPPTGGDPGSGRASGVAYAKGRVYVSWQKRDVVSAYEAASGELLQTWPVPAPRRLAATIDHVLWVISSSAVIRINAISNSSEWVSIDHHLDMPQGIAVDSNGLVYVANAGALQNVSVFDSDGKYLRSIGKKGGRPAKGGFDRNGMYQPGGIAVSANGRLWVTETTDGPKRHSVWDAATGAWVKDFYGASSYFGWAWIDPERPDEMYCHNVLWRIDWTNNTCEPLTTIWRRTTPDMFPEPMPDGYRGHFRILTATNGHQFGWGGTSLGEGLYMRDGDLFRPIAGTFGAQNRAKGESSAIPAMQDAKAFPPARAWLWQDANADQLVQSNEIIVAKDTYRRNFCWVDRDLNLWSPGQVFRPVRFEADGRPVYDFSRPETTPAFRGRGELWLDATDPDAVYTVCPGADPGLCRWQKNGTCLWGFRGIAPWQQALNLDMGTPGKLYGLTTPLGVAGAFTGVACYANPYYLFTTDGLYVSMIMRNGRDGKLGPDITASETLTGQLVKLGDNYFLLAGDQDGRVTQVLGLETVKRLPGGAFTLTDTEVETAARAWRDYEAKRAQAQKLTLARGLQGLSASPAVGKTIDSGRGFQARAAYDSTNLYVQFDVSGSDLMNSFSDPNLVFKGGNCLDIQLAGDPNADPKRKTPVPGDIRILVTRQLAADGPSASSGQAKTLAMVYRPKVKDLKGEPIVMNSPTGQESFDAIERSASVGLVYRKQGSGFQATVTVPLELLGWTPKPGATIRMDLGYLFGNANGSTVAARAYWCNNGFSANVVNDVPSESRLEPAAWGEATIE